MVTFLDPHEVGALASRARNDDPTAFADLVRLCQPFVRSQAARCCHGSMDPDDIVQEVWMRLFRGLAQIRDTDGLLAWLTVVTRRVAIDLAWRSDRSLATEGLSEQAGDDCTEDDGIQRPCRDEIVDGVRAAIGQLKPRDQVLLLELHASAQPCYLSISERLSRPVGSLGPTRMRLLRRLRNEPQLRLLAGSL